MPVDIRLIDSANSILTNLTTALTTAGISVPSRRYPHSGQIPPDFVGSNCADAFIVSWQGSAGGTVEAGGGPTPPIRCAMPLTHRFAIALFRCVPTIKTTAGNQVKFPTAEEMDASATQILTDAMTLSAVLVDLVLSDSLLDNAINIVGIESVLPVGPSGALGGTLLTIRATVM